MKLRTVFPQPLRRSIHIPSLSRVLTIRTSSTSTSTSTSTSSSLHLETSLCKDLTSREPNIIHDYISPTQSHLLNISLADFLPPSCYPSHFLPSDLYLPSCCDERFLPPGHHLVYFPPHVLSRDLLPDGTDPLQSPGAPFTRRMWAGGSIIFNPELKHRLQLDGTRAVCIERMVDVKVMGKEGKEKVFVGIERKIASLRRKVHGSFYNGCDEEWREKIEERVGYFKRIPQGELNALACVERRDIVYMRDKSRQEAEADAGKIGRVVKPVHRPDFSTAITVTQQLLFRFSALSFNAHGIHLDSQYCRDVEGYRNLLVHGPLSLVLMLSVLRSQLKHGEMIRRFDYRNLAPLFATEEMRVCVRRDPMREKRFDVWIQGKEGGYAVKGMAIVEPEIAPGVPGGNGEVLGINPVLNS